MTIENGEPPLDIEFAEDIAVSEELALEEGEPDKSGRTGRGKSGTKGDIVAQGKRYRSKQRRLAIIALGGRCSSCESTDTNILEIHHKYLKGEAERKTGLTSANFHRFIRNNPLEANAKYELLCANCDRKKHPVAMSSERPGNQKMAATRCEQSEYRRAISSARHAVTRLLAQANSGEERQLALGKMRSSQEAWSAESRYQILLMSLEGKSAAQIAAQFGLHPGTVKNLLSELRRERTWATAELIDAHRAILLARAEMIAEKYAPIALDPDLFERLERGEVVSETALGRAFRSALILLAVGNFQCRLLGLFNNPHGRRKPRAEGQSEAANVWWPSKVNWPSPSESKEEDEVIFSEEIPERPRS